MLPGCTRQRASLKRGVESSGAVGGGGGPGDHLGLEQSLFL